jgi:hypothetical protein
MRRSIATKASRMSAANTVRSALARSIMSAANEQTMKRSVIVRSEAERVLEQSDSTIHSNNYAGACSEHASARSSEARRRPKADKSPDQPFRGPNFPKKGQRPTK